MSLLDTGNHDVVIYPEVEGQDADGNPVMVPSAVGTAVKARVQPVRSTEDHTLGQDTETLYRLRVDRQVDVPLGPWSAVEHDGARFSVLGQPDLHTGSGRTRHVTAVLRRA